MFDVTECLIFPFGPLAFVLLRGGGLASSFFLFFINLTYIHLKSHNACRAPTWDNRSLTHGFVAPFAAFVVEVDMKTKSMSKLISAMIKPTPTSLFKQVSSYSVLVDVVFLHS